MREFQRVPRGYELMVLINPEVTDEALSAAIDQVGAYITSGGAEITYTKRDTPWGRRRLAYQIDRFRDATYVLFQFMASPSVLTEIERELKLDDRVIRYLLVRQDNLHVSGEEAATSESAEVTAASGEPDEAEQDEDVETDELDVTTDDENEDEESNETDE